MEKTYYKPALALLYLLQLLIVFRESVAEAYKHAVEAIHGEVDLAEADATKHHGAAVAQEGRRKPSGELGPFIEHGASALAGFVLAHAVHPDEHHVLHPHSHSHPETEDETKKMRRKRWREVLLANLFPSFQRFAEPTQAVGATVFTLLRPVSFPAA